jgi:hypothetical protein
LINPSAASAALHLLQPSTLLAPAAAPLASMGAGAPASASALGPIAANLASLEDAARHAVATLLEQIRRTLDSLWRWLSHGSPRGAGNPGPGDLPVPALPASPVVPVGSSNLSASGGGQSLHSLTAAPGSASALPPAARARLRVSPSASTAVFVSLIERPGWPRPVA